MKRLSFLQTTKIRFFSETMPSYAKKNMYRIVQQQEWTATMQWWPSVPPLTQAIADCKSATAGKPLRIANPFLSGGGLQIRHSGNHQQRHSPAHPHPPFHPPYLAPHLRPPTSDQAAGRPCRQGAPAPQPLPSFYIVSIFFLFYCCFISVTGTKR